MALCSVFSVWQGAVYPHHPALRDQTPDAAAGLPDGGGAWPVRALRAGARLHHR